MRNFSFRPESTTVNESFFTDFIRSNNLGKFKLHKFCTTKILKTSVGHGMEVIETERITKPQEQAFTRKFLELNTKMQT